MNMHPSFSPVLSAACNPLFAMLWRRESNKWVDNSFSVPQQYFSMPILKVEWGYFCTWCFSVDF